MADSDQIWRRGGTNVEDLPDPLAPAPPPGDGRPPIDPVARAVRRLRRRRVLKYGAYAFFALFLITILWLVITAPLSRALEPLPAPAMLIVADNGEPIARRGAVKDAPVDVTKLNPLTPAAFVAIEDRRFLDRAAMRERAAFGADKQHRRNLERLKRTAQRSADHQPQQCDHQQSAENQEPQPPAMPAPPRRLCRGRGRGKRRRR